MRYLVTALASGWLLLGHGTPTWGQSWPAAQVGMPAAATTASPSVIGSAPVLSRSNEESFALPAVPTPMAPLTNESQRAPAAVFAMQPLPRGGNDRDPQLEALRNDLRQTIERLNATQNELQALRQSLPPRPTAPTEESVDPGQRISSLETAFNAFQRQLSTEASGKFPSARLTGFTQLDDYALYQTPANRAVVGNGQNGVGFRRARVAIVGNIATFTSYIVEVDFATAGRPSFFDVWAEQSNLPIFNAVRVGQFLQPFSVDAMSGFRNLPFLERSLPFNCFVPFRRVGAMSSVNTENERTYWANSVFKTGGYNNGPIGDSRFATDIGNQNGYSYSSRMTHLLWYDELAGDRYLWQIGGSYDFSAMSAGGGASTPFYQAHTRPEFGPIGDGLDTAPATFGPTSYAASNFTPPVFIDTGRYQASNFNLLGLETLYQAGALSLQAEFMATGVQSVVGPIWYTGGYGEVMYRLTGEHRKYDRRLGALANPVPFTELIPLGKDGIRGWGAWEVAARLSYVDLRNPSSLNGHYLSGTNNSGNGTLTDTTVGLTWFLNAHTKLQMNWIHAMLNNTSTVPTTAHGYTQANFLASRLQIDF